MTKAEAIDEVEKLIECLRDWYMIDMEILEEEFDINLKEVIKALKK